MKSLLLKNILQLLQVQSPENEKGQVTGSEMGLLPMIENAYLYCEGGKIKAFGKMEDLSKASSFFLKDAVELDCSQRIVLPTWCDSHTHLVFAATREKEFVARIKGESYESIAKNGGGILNSAKRLQLMSESELLASAWLRLQQVIAMGTGAIEIKSGYGLTIESEIKMLRVIQQLKKISPIPIKSTFLAAHAFPMEYKQNHEGYIRLIIEEMLPLVAKENLADYIDVFCEDGFFNAEETARILKAGAHYGLKPKIHANQLHYSGGVQVGVENNAISVDHLECIGEAELASLLASKTIPTLLPSAAFFLGIGYQPARKLIDAGLPVTLASDYNPGTSPSGNMNFVLSLACTQMKMTPEEAINAATINGAAAMELQATLGSIAIGKTANLIITEAISSYEVLPYSFGRNCIEKVILNGQL
jgi:imidazolonepropionase